MMMIHFKNNFGISYRQDIISGAAQRPTYLLHHLKTGFPEIFEVMLCIEIENRITSFD